MRQEIMCRVNFFLLLLFLLSSCTEDKHSTRQAVDGIPVRVEVPEPRMITDWQEFTGRFQATDRVEIRARVSGYLEEVKFIDGQDVKKGDVLFVIDQRPFAIALKSAEASFELANKEFKRAESLRQSKAISEEDYDQRIQEMRVASAQMEEAKLNLEFTEIKAPFDGRISRSLVSVGSLISGGSTSATHLTTLVTVSPIEFYFEGSESDIIAYIRARQKGEVPQERLTSHPVFLRLQDEKEFIHEGVFNFADNEINQDTSTIEARATFNNEEKLFAAGMFGRIRVAWYKPKELLVVPETIIGTEQNRKYIYALDDESRAIRKYVTLGHVTDDGKRVIKEGLERGDQIVVGGLHMVRPGALISPISPEQAEAGQGNQ